MGRRCGIAHEFTGMSNRYKKVLGWVIGINALLFGVEMVAGIEAQSQALQADALDFLGDTLTYGLSLWAIGKPLSSRSTVALWKGRSLFIMALWVVGSTAYRIFYMGSPSAYTMGSISIAAFLANFVSVLLLLKYREGDANVKSVWLCSRNDAIGNLAVLCAASGVWASGSAWPDLFVALVLASLFLTSSWQILQLAHRENRTLAEHFANQG